MPSEQKKSYRASRFKIPTFIDTKTIQSIGLDVRTTNSTVRVASFELLLKYLGKCEANLIMGTENSKKIICPEWII